MVAKTSPITPENFLKLIAKSIQKNGSSPELPFFNEKKKVDKKTNKVLSFDLTGQGFCVMICDVVFEFS